LGRVLRLPHVRRAARHRAVQHPARRPVLVADWRKSTATTDPLGPRPAHPYRGRVQASKPTNPGQQLGPSSPLHGRGRPRLLPRVGSPSPGQPAQRQLQRRRPSRGTGSGVPAQSSAGLRRPRTALRCRCCERPWKAAWEASWSAVSGDLAASTRWRRPSVGWPLRCSTAATWMIDELSVPELAQRPSLGSRRAVGRSRARAPQEVKPVMRCPSGVPARRTGLGGEKDQRFHWPGPCRLLNPRQEAGQRFRWSWRCGGPART
jgi:hypothetical protein